MVDMNSDSKFCAGQASAETWWPIRVCHIGSKACNWYLLSFFLSFNERVDFFQPLYVCSIET